MTRLKDGTPIRHGYYTAYVVSNKNRVKLVITYVHKEKGDAEGIMRVFDRI